MDHPDEAPLQLWGHDSQVYVKCKTDVDRHARAYKRMKYTNEITEEGGIESITNDCNESNLL